MRVLQKMQCHGMGDNVQFTAVLAHLEKLKPEWDNIVLSQPGKVSVFGASGTVVNLPRDLEYDHRWREAGGNYTDLPATKTVRCLREIFGLKPEWDLLRYRVPIPQSVQAEADEAVKLLPARPFVVIHYRGNSSPQLKNLEHDDIRTVCDWLVTQNITPVILDFEHRSPLPDGVNVHRASIRQDGATMAALMKRAALTLTIDSGPGKIAQAIDTPNISVWTGFHPYHFCDNAPNAFHLVPVGHESRIRGDREAALSVFQKFYKHEEYQPDLLPQHIIIKIADILNIKIRHMNNLLKSTSFDASYYLEHKLAGLDYLSYGDWQHGYGRWMVDALKLKGKTVLDVGCACGALACGFAEAGALVSGVDANEHMITLGRSKRLASTLKIGDACNLHHWKKHTFDFVHSAQVFEHFRPELIPHILKELRRVTKPMGTMFAALDTTEMYERQGRKLENEDPTHTAVFSLKWWFKALLEAGWSVDDVTLQNLKKHPLSYFKSHDWDAFYVVNPG